LWHVRLRPACDVHLFLPDVHLHIRQSEFSHLCERADRREFPQVRFERAHRSSLDETESSQECGEYSITLGDHWTIDSNTQIGTGTGAVQCDGGVSANLSIKNG